MQKKRQTITINQDLKKIIDEGVESMTTVVNRALEKEIKGFFSEDEKDLIHDLLANVKGRKGLVRSIRGKL